MKSNLRTLLFSGDRQFVFMRSLSMIAALTFALLYSKQLGVERRGLLTFVMTTNLVFSIFLISGISLHLRNLTKTGLKENILGTYLAAIITFSFVTPILNVCMLNLYRFLFDVKFPNNLLYVSIVYCFFSTLSYGMHDALLLIKSIKIASIIDFGVVLIQIAVYFTLLYVGETSYFVSVLISMAVSYLVMVSAVLLLLIYAYNPRLNFSFTTFKKLVLDSSTLTLLNMASQLLERIDKVFLGLQTSASELGRFSTSQSIIGIYKFLPDSIGKLSLARNKSYINLRISRLKLVLATGLVVSSIGGLAFLVVRFFLGSPWELPLLMVFTIVFVEIIRGFYGLLSINAVRSDAYQRLKTITIFQLVCGLFIQPVAIHFFGLWGSLGSSLVVLFVGIFALREYVGE